MIEKSTFGNMPDGQQVESYRLSNDAGMAIEILTLGGIIRSWTPAASNIDIVLGFDTVDDYLADQGYIGRTVGRYANRIKEGKFSLGDDEFSVSTNLQGNSLHGGVDGFHNRVWTVTETSQTDSPSVTLSLISEDGDQGFPGALSVDVKFAIDQHNCLTIEYRALSNKDTVFNPTHHSYFNLAGHDSGSIFEQLICVNASYYTPADKLNIPTGEIKAVDSTPFDLRKPVRFGDVIQHPSDEIVDAGGLDHNWCVDGVADSQRSTNIAASAYNPENKLALICQTTMPGVQIYSGNFIGSIPKGKNEVEYGAHHGFCIESQFYPDSPNQATFPSAELKANQPFVSRTSYQLVQE